MRALKDFIRAADIPVSGQVKSARPSL